MLCWVPTCARVGHDILWVADNNNMNFRINRDNLVCGMLNTRGVLLCLLAIFYGTAAHACSRHSRNGSGCRGMLDSGVHPRLVLLRTGWAY